MICCQKMISYFFIKKILGDKYEDFQKIIALKKDIYYSFHKHYSTKNTNNYIVYSSVKDVVKYSKKKAFSSDYD